MANISRSECVEIVRKSYKGRHFDEQWIKSFQVDRVSEDLVGYMGEYFKLFVDLDNGGEARRQSFFVKSVPISNEIHRKECLEKGFFTKEMQLYAKLLGDIQKYASKRLLPDCYYTRGDMVVLEDLSVQNLRHIDTGEDIPIEFFKVVLRNHAASIAYELDTGVNIGERFHDILYELQVTMNNVCYVTGIKGIVTLAKRISKYHGTPVEDFISNELYDIMCSACSLTEPSDVHRNVLCHRDSWTRNIFFECDENDVPIDCVLFDFQLPRYSPPAIDVLYLISMVTRKKQRDIISAECLEFYYNTFVEVMTEKGLEKEIFSQEEFLNGCHRLDLVVLIMKALCVPMMELPAGVGSKIQAEEPEVFDHFLNVDREVLLLRLMDTVPGYKELVLEPVEELVEYLVNELKLL